MGRSGNRSRRRRRIRQTRRRPARPQRNDRNEQSHDSEQDAQEPGHAPSQDTGRSLDIPKEWAIGLSLVLIGAYVTWRFAPWQEVRSQRAVEQDQRQRAGREAALRYDARYAFQATDGYVYAVPVPLPDVIADRLTVAEIPVDRESTAQKYDSGPIERYTWNTISPLGAVRLSYPRPRPGAPPRQMLTRVLVILEGRRVDPVLITDIRARVLRKSPSLNGALINGAPQGEGDTVQLGFDLDSPHLSARQADENGELGAPYITKKYIQLTKGESIPVQVLAYAARNYYEWVIDVTVRVGGREENITISDRGEPFRTTGLAARYKQEYQFMMNVYPNRWAGVSPSRRK